MRYINRSAIKAEAKYTLRVNRRSFLIMTAIYMGISLIISGIDFAFTRFEIPMAAFITILVSLITCVLSAGYILFCMGVRQGEDMPFSTLLDGFGFAGKVIWLNILMYIYIFLWSMLFVIPGIVAAYRYRFALYNLMENPELTASQAIALSKMQTFGMKGQLLMLDLSFFGWAILTALTAGILSIWLTPYMQLADLGYYEVGKEIVSPFPNGGPTSYDDQGFNQF